MELTEGNQSSFTKCKSSFISTNRITRACAPDSKDSAEIADYKKNNRNTIFSSNVFLEIQPLSNFKICERQINDTVKFSTDSTC